MYEKFGQFIDGKWQHSSSGDTYDVINPATEELIGKASKANSKDVQRALRSAEKGLEVWKNTSPWERSKIIRKISELMRQRIDILSKWLTLEVGKPLTEGSGEVGGAADIFEWNSEETKRIFGEINQSRFPNTKILDFSNRIEGHLSGKSIERIFAEKFKEKISAKEIFNGYRNKDANSTLFINEYKEMLSRCLVTIITTIDPDAIVFGGGISSEIDFLDEIKQKTSMFINEPNLKTVFLKPKYGDASGVRGAAILGRQNSI